MEERLISRRLLDALLWAGLALALSVMGMPLYFLTKPGFHEINLVMIGSLGFGHHVAILMLGIVWPVIFFTTYYRLRRTKCAVYISFLSFSVCTFNFVHDLAVVVGTR